MSLERYKQAFQCSLTTTFARPHFDYCDQVDVLESYACFVRLENLFYQNDHFISFKK